MQTFNNESMILDAFREVKTKEILPLGDRLGDTDRLFCTEDGKEFAQGFYEYGYKNLSQGLDYQ